MDDQSYKFYMSLSKIFPYLLTGTIVAVPINYLIMNSMQKFSSQSLGWPFKAGSVEAGIIQVEFWGLLGNFILWSLMLSAVFSFLLYIYKTRKGL